MIAAQLLAAATAGWQHAAAIDASPARPVYVQVTLPQKVDGGPDASYADVRVADSQNREVPYALDATPAAAYSVPATLSDFGFVRGSYTQAVADLGPSGTLHADIEIESTQPTYFQRVEIATSDDRKTWALVRTDALIYRVAESNDAGDSTVEFPPTRARWIRIRILDGNRLFPLTGASVPAAAPTARLAPLAATSTIHSTGDQTIATLDFGDVPVDVNAVAFESSTWQFSRHVSFAVDGEDAGDGTISRFAQGRPELVATFGARHGRRLRVTIDNGNDAPLAGLRVTPLGYRHHIVFPAQPGERYRLLWGNPDAGAPVYDLASRLQHEDWNVSIIAPLGAPASTALTLAATAPSTPFLQNAALPIALSVAFLVLLVIALTAMRQKPEA